MTMDEVNERFPLIKYKVWRSSRADDGLPTAGGITAPNSRPRSLGDESDIPTASLNITSPSTLLPMKSHRRLDSNISQSTPDQTETILIHSDEKTANSLSISDNASPSLAAGAEIKPSYEQPENVSHGPEDSDDDGDLIRTAIPTELLPSAGDTCAICLDTIEDDDDIRGLSCGHAFHASCVDPWLTSRRACCPLCKADYHVPRPRTDTVEGTSGTERRGRHTTARTRTLNQPQAAFIGTRVNPFRTRMVLPGRFLQTMSPEPTSGLSQSTTQRAWHAQNDDSQVPRGLRNAAVEPFEQQSRRSRLVPNDLRRLSTRSFRLPRWLRGRSGTTPPTAVMSHTEENRTLRQLEGGSTA